LRNLRERGYRRVGYAVSQAFHERTGQNFTGGYLADQQSLPVAERIPPHYIEWTKPQDKAIADWYRKYQPDVVLMEGDFETRSILQKAIDTKHCDLASLSVQENSPFAGIQQNNIQIGRLAVDQLVARMQRGERGIPEIPFFCLIEGKWVDGPSLRKSTQRQFTPSQTDARAGKAGCVALKVQVNRGLCAGKRTIERGIT
jgi:LacI family transcriptional regulator/LacI family repressor for deo operon, udp, cdd, tsx, nupC, and nupG